MLTDKLLKQQVQYVENPEKWAVEMCGFYPDTWQLEALQEFNKEDFQLWSTGHGVGKTGLLSICLLYYLTTRPFSKVPCTAPTQHQLFDLLWAEAAKWMRRSTLLSNMLKWTQTKISVRGHEEEWFAVARTSRPKPGEQNVEGLQGFHAEHLLFIVDEASGVPDAIFSAIDGALTTRGAKVLLAGNPTKERGYFYKRIKPFVEMAEEGKRSHHDGVWSIKFIDNRKSKFVAPGYDEKIANDWGRESDIFRIKVQGLPPQSASNALITPSMIEEMHERTATDDGPVVLSCDPARFGPDESVYYARKGLTFLGRWKLKGMDTQKVAEFGVDLFNKFNADEYNIDGIGIGAGVVDATKKMLGRKRIRVVDVNIGSAANDAKKFLNLRAELFWGLREVIQQVSVPFETPMLDEELPIIHYKWDNKDLKIQTLSKDAIKSILGRSPNDADSFVINLKRLIHASTMRVSKTYFDVGKITKESSMRTGSSRIIEDVDGGADDSAGSRTSWAVVGKRRYSRFSRGSGGVHVGDGGSKWVI